MEFGVSSLFTKRKLFYLEPRSHILIKEQISNTRLAKSGLLRDPSILFQRMKSKSSRRDNSNLWLKMRVYMSEIYGVAK